MDSASWVVAIATVFIAGATGWQWWVSRKAFKLGMFERRFDVYEKIGGFLSGVQQTQLADEVMDLQFKLLRLRKSVCFLFGDDIVKLTEEMYDKALLLQQAMRKTAHERAEGESRERYLKNADDIREWFSVRLDKLDETFLEYLKLDEGFCEWVKLKELKLKVGGLFGKICRLGSKRMHNMLSWLTTFWKGF